MDKLRSILNSGEKPWTGIYLRILAFAYLTAVILRFSSLFGLGETNLDIPVAARTADIVFAQLGAITMVGLWLRKPWGIACFLISAFLHLVLYWGFPELFIDIDAQEAPFQDLINFHLSSIGIFFILQINGK